MQTSQTALSGFMHHELASARYKRLYIHIGVGFFVARSRYRAMREASECGTSNRYRNSTLLFVCSNQPSRIYCISQRETLSLIKCKFARSANGTYCSTSKLTRDMILKQLHRFRTLILYGIIGSFSSFLDFIIYTLLTGYVGLFYITANCISVLMGITTSFALNRKYNFKVKDKTGKRFFIFLTVGLCGLLMSNLILYVCIARLQYNTTLSKLLSIILVVFLQFLINKYITFKQTQQPNNG